MISLDGLAMHWLMNEEWNGEGQKDILVTCQRSTGCGPWDCCFCRRRYSIVRVVEEISRCFPLDRDWNIGWQRHVRVEKRGEGRRRDCNVWVTAKVNADVPRDRFDHCSKRHALSSRLWPWKERLEHSVERRHRTEHCEENCSSFRTKTSFPVNLKRKETI